MNNNLICNKCGQDHSQKLEKWCDRSDLEIKTQPETVKICRVSGLPVNVKDMEDFKSEWRRLFDIAQKVAKTDMLRLQKRLVTIERILSNRFPTITEVPLPTNAEQWTALQADYGNIIVTQHKDTKEVILAIYDVEDQRY